MATKFGLISHPSGERSLDSSPVEGSPRRLSTDFTDLYYQHRVNPKPPIEEVAGTLAELATQAYCVMPRKVRMSP
jgi:aryl-alcohol dehydrogenase-like predicted oxidoreductase